MSTKAKTSKQPKKETTDFTARFMMWMAAAILGFTFIYIFAITFIEVPEANQRFADTIIGFLVGTLAGTVINYFYGSSRGSNDKNKTLEVLSMLQSKLNEAVDETRTLVDEDEEETAEEAQDFDGRTMTSSESFQSTVTLTTQTSNEVNTETPGVTAPVVEDKPYATGDDLKRANQ